MIDPLQQRISCQNPEEMIQATNKVVVHLESDDRKRFNEIRLKCLHLHSLDELFRRANGRTVAEFLAEYTEEDDDWSPAISGEIDGVQYKLHKAPDANRKKD